MSSVSGAWCQPWRADLVPAIRNLAHEIGAVPRRSLRSRRTSRARPSVEELEHPSGEPRISLARVADGRWSSRSRVNVTGPASVRVHVEELERVDGQRVLVDRGATTSAGSGGVATVAAGGAAGSRARGTRRLKPAYTAYGARWKRHAAAIIGSAAHTASARRCAAAASASPRRGTPNRTSVVVIATRSSLAWIANARARAGEPPAQVLRRVRVRPLPAPGSRRARR